MKDGNDNEQRYLLTFEGSGHISAYKMDEQWRLAKPGSPEYMIQGHVKIVDDGYIIEFSLPASFLNASQQLGVAVADVNDPEGRNVMALYRSFPKIAQGQYNRLIVRSPETERILASLAQTDSQIWVLDKQLRVRASVGQLQRKINFDPLAPSDLDQPRQSFTGLLLNWLSGVNNGPLNDFDPAQTLARDEQFIRAALEGKSSVTRRPTLDGKHIIVAAIHPVYHADKGSVLGLVLLEQTTDAILNLQSRSLQRIAIYSLLGLIAITLVVLVFSTRLTWRIKRLGTDTQKATDEQGRMQTALKFRGLKAADEIGDLTRHIEQLLARLDRYQQFLVAIPRTLRHEINNPLNTVATSLEHLEDQSAHKNAADQSDKDNSELTKTYLDSAQRGLQRIAAITENLAEAASLEDALSADELLRLDFCHLVTSYVTNQQRQQSHPFTLKAPNHEVWVQGSDIHLEQLLDKLLSNAIDFSVPYRPVELELSVTKTHCLLGVTNHGPVIPEAELNEIFQLFRGRRGHQLARNRNDSEGAQHLGLGLYVAQIICERHGGDLVAENLSTGDGVIFTASLPLDG